MLTSQMIDVFFNFTVSSRVSREHNGSRDVLTSVSTANGYNLYSNTMADGTPELLTISASIYAV